MATQDLTDYYGLMGKSYKVRRDSKEPDCIFCATFIKKTRIREIANKIWSRSLSLVAVVAEREEKAASNLRAMR